MQYRLHIDIPLGFDEDQAVKIAKSITYWHFEDKDAQDKLNSLTGGKISRINYRLGHDEDRQKSNYLDKNENGHVSNKKIQINFGK